MIDKTTHMESAQDILQVERTFSCSIDSSSTQLICKIYKVGTCNHENSPYTEQNPSYITRPPEPWDALGVSAHANALEVAKFFEQVLEYSGLDGNGTQEYISYVYIKDDNVAWFPCFNAFLYGEHLINSNNKSSEIFYYASDIKIVAHEMFHGINYFTVNLEGENESGALNESYADIFGILLGNKDKNKNIDNWNWEINVSGDPENLEFPSRDLSDPQRFEQPSHMRDYQNTEEDQGGVHANSGIHNYAAYKLLTSKDTWGNYLFDISSAAFLFYSAFIQLKPKAEFSDSKLALFLQVYKCFSEPRKQRLVEEAINAAFDSVGIQ